MRKNIFLIDDDEDELEIFDEALKMLALPYKCSYAGSGEQAIQTLEYLLPDIIFVDINMPKQSGFEFLNEIKKNPRLISIPLFMYSNGINKDVREKAIKLGASGCVKKMPTIRSLADELERAMNSTL
jgi:CheY-like chemotaxis protein